MGAAVSYRREFFMSPAFRRWPFFLAIVSSIWVGISVLGVAQPPGNTSKIEKDFRDNKGKLTDAANSGKKTSIEVMDAGAQYFTYRVMWHDASGSDSAVSHIKQFEAFIKLALAGKATDPSFANAFSPVLVARFKEMTDLPVVDNARPLVHLTQMMPTLAKLHDDTVNRYLLDLLDPKAGKHDLIKLGAIKALREFMPVDGWGDTSIESSLLQDKIKMARKSADKERIAALTQFILRPPTGLTKSEELEAFRYLRREAIETLAEAKAPAVAAFVLKGKGEVEGPIASVLLGVLMPGMNPETNLYERNEAALGLANMKAFELYNPAPAYYFINKTLYELAQDFSNDFANIKEDEKRKIPTTFPWKVTAKRWEAGLRQLVASADKSNKKKAEQIESNARPVLGRMFDQKANVDANVVAPIVSMAPPAEFSLFKSTIKSEPLKWDGAK